MAMRPYGNRSVGPRSILPAYQPQTGRGVPLYALRQGLRRGRSVAIKLLSQISRIGGRMAMRPYGNRSVLVSLIALIVNVATDDASITIPNRLGSSQFLVCGVMHQLECGCRSILLHILTVSCLCLLLV